MLSHQKSNNAHFLTLPLNDTPEEGENFLMLTSSISNHQWREHPKYLSFDFYQLVLQKQSKLLWMLSNILFTLIDSCMVFPWHFSREDSFLCGPNLLSYIMKHGY